MDVAHPHWQTEGTGTATYKYECDHENECRAAVQQKYDEHKVVAELSGPRKVAVDAFLVLADA